MAIQISGNTVITDGRVLQNVSGFKTINSQAILGTGNITTSGNYVMQVFTGGATWTKPADLVAVKVTVVGAGGGSTGSPTEKSGAGGGGTSIDYIHAPLIPGPVTVTVGTGGTGAGNTSSFGTFCSATGGGAAPGSGGTGSGGTANFTGGSGGDSGSISKTWSIPNQSPGLNGISYATTGAGGSSIFGGGGLGGSTSSVSPPGAIIPIAPTSGYTYGGGASGAVSNATTATGFQGIVIVEEFY